MMMNSTHKVLLGAAIVTLLVAVFATLPSMDEKQLNINSPQTVNHVDVDRYLGRWYEQASIPANFEKGCVNTQAFYSLIDSKTIKVDNLCYVDGKKKESLGKGFIEDNTNAKLKVVFNPIFKFGGQYWIVKLGDAQNYGYSVVSSPDYKYLWILSRE